MKKFQNNNFRISYIKENSYDQMTRLKYDLQRQLYREIVLPKIHAKFVQSSPERYLKISPQQRNMKSSDRFQEIQSRKYLYNKVNMKNQMGNSIICLQNNSSYRYNNISSSIYYKCIPIIIDKIQRQPQINQRQYSEPRLTHNMPRIQYENEDQGQMKSIDKLKSTYQTSNIQKITKRKKEKKKEQLSNNENPKKQIKAKEKDRKSDPKIRRKFRIIVYAVYFTLLLPAYARKVYKNRVKDLIKDYPHQISKFYSSDVEVKPSKYKRDELKLWSYFLSNLSIQQLISKSTLFNVLDSNHQIKDIKQTIDFLIKIEMEDTQQTVDFKPNYQEQLTYPKNIPAILQGCESIVLKVVHQLVKQIKHGTFFNQKWKTFSLGLINNEFCNNSHPKILPKMIESGLIQLHPTKETVFITNSETQIIFLTYDIFTRIYCYKWMSYIFKLKKQNKDIQKLKTIANIYLSLMYLSCEQMMDNYLKNNKVSQKNIKLKERNRYIRPIIPLILKETRKRDEKLLKTTNLIANPPLKDQANYILQEKPEFAQKIFNYLKLVGKQLYHKIETYKKQELQLIKEKTLCQKKLIRDYCCQKQNIERNK